MLGRLSQRVDSRARSTFQAFGHTLGPLCTLASLWSPSVTPSRDVILADVARRLDAADVFGEITRPGETLVARAKASAEPAQYTLSFDGGSWWVSLTMADRWLSESIETDLVHSGDSLDELLEDEMVELDLDGPAPKVEHFRSEAKLFTFRAKVPGEATPDRIARFVLAFEACFSHLGDMSAA